MSKPFTFSPYSYRPTSSAFSFFPFSDSGVSIPPTNTLIAWLKGTNLTDSVKLDSVNGYNFTFDSCPLVPVLDGAGDPVYEADGVTPIYEASPDYSGWGCIYSAPASGQTGYDELLAVDDGTLYSVRVPIPLNLTALNALNLPWIFFSESSGKGLGIYSGDLTGQDLTDANDFFS